VVFINNRKLHVLAYNCACARPHTQTHTHTHTHQEQELPDTQEIEEEYKETTSMYITHYLRYIKREAHTTKFTHFYISHTCSLSHRKRNAPSLRTHNKTLEADKTPPGTRSSEV